MDETPRHPREKKRCEGCCKFFFFTSVVLWRRTSGEGGQRKENCYENFFDGAYIKVASRGLCKIYNIFQYYVKKPQLVQSSLGRKHLEIFEIFFFFFLDLGFFFFFRIQNTQQQLNLKIKKGLWIRFFFNCRPLSVSKTCSSPHNTSYGWSGGAAFDKLLYSWKTRPQSEDDIPSLLQKGKRERDKAKKRMRTRDNKLKREREQKNRNVPPSFIFDQEQNFFFFFTSWCFQQTEWSASRVCSSVH